MKTLSDFTPAQTLLLTRGKRVPIKDLLKVTMMDLLLKKVLKTVEVENGFRDDSNFLNTYVVIGEKFSSNKSLPHEEIFLSPFYTDEHTQFLFNNIVKVAYQKAGSEKQYNKLIRESAALHGCFTSGLGAIFSPFELSSSGRQIATELKRQLKTLSDHLPNLMETDQRKALEVLKHVQGNVFLVKGIDFKRMVEIEKAVMAEVYSTQSVSNSFFGDPVTWLALDISSRRFDSSYSGCSTVSASWDGEGSDSGNSGCSGCSGCGGD
jgi:hypothetical protein